MTEPVIMHVRCGPDITPEAYRQLLDLLGELSPLVQPIPPAAALVEVGGVLRLYRTTPADLAQRVCVWVLLHGIGSVRIGVADTWATAATASAHTSPSDVLWLPDHRATTAFLGGLDIEALYSVGTKTAQTLRRYRLYTIGALAAQPDRAVCRLVGKQGRTLPDRARGIDPRRVAPRPLPEAASLSHAFDRDMLDPVLLSAALLDLLAALAERIRRRDQVARALTLPVRLADGSRTERTRRLLAPPPTPTTCAPPGGRSGTPSLSSVPAFAASPSPPTTSPQLQPDLAHNSPCTRPAKRDTRSNRCSTGSTPSSGTPSSAPPVPTVSPADPRHPATLGGMLSPERRRALAGVFAMRQDTPSAGGSDSPENDQPWGSGQMTAPVSVPVTRTHSALGMRRSTTYQRWLSRFVSVKYAGSSGVQTGIPSDRNDSGGRPLSFPHVCHGWASRSGSSSSNRIVRPSSWCWGSVDGSGESVVCTIAGTAPP
ncbi:hypothetical protein ACIQKB_36855 [Streptomyces sp. NPDC092046]|uniref:DinB/UmuC family translesion DNA polymerase n=1 Tax=Streptomyces sp. NPDC092046 TaxID=3366009 RepID=UPI00382C95CC